MREQRSVERILLLSLNNQNVIDQSVVSHLFRLLFTNKELILLLSNVNKKRSKYNIYSVTSRLDESVSL